jgi:hypothetical protein
MSDITTHLGLPYLLAAQAQKHVTHNEALRLLDGMVQLSVLDRTRTAPPASPADGDRHLVAAEATGLWEGWDQNIAFRADGAWLRLVPRPGWLVWVASEGQFRVWTGSAWDPVVVLPSDITAGTLALGGATADSTTRLAVNAAAILMNHAGAGIDASVNKAAAGNDASLAFRTGLSARARMGLLGTDDWRLRVSADGTTFLDAMIADRLSGRVQFPAGVAISGLASDPASPADGWLWYNATASQLRARIAGQTVALGSRQVPFLVPASGEHVMTSSMGAVTGTQTGAAGRIRLFPWAPGADLAVDQMAINVTTEVAGALGKIAVYSADANGRPDQLILETGDLDLGTLGVRSIAAALTLRAGRTYWFGLRHSSTATVSVWSTSGTADINGGTPATTARKTLQRTIAYATAAPTTWGFDPSEINASVATAIWLRMA